MNFVDKISSYNIITNLIPGIVELEGLRATGIPLINSKDLATWLVLAYLLGMVSSRVGSLIAGPIIRRFLTPKENSYRDYIKACKEDPKIEILQETNNGYRTLIGAGVCYFFIVSGYEILDYFLFLDRHKVICAAAILTMIFTLSYTKQLRYISNRVSICTQDRFD